MGTLVGEKRSGSGRLASRNGVPYLEETYEYTILASSKTETRQSILTNTSGFPTLGSQSPGGLGVCRATDATRRDENPLYWDATAEFSSEVDENQDDDLGGDPESWVPIYETKFERYQEVITETVEATPQKITNSAGMPLPSDISRTRHIPIWEFYQFENANVTDETVIGRSEKVNASKFRGRDPKTLLCVVTYSAIGFYYGKRRRLTRYQLKYKSDTWKHRALDLGYQHLGNTSPALVPYYNRINPSLGLGLENLEHILGPLSNGEPAGGYIDSSDVANNDGTEPDVLEFDIYETDSFSFLR